MKSEIYLMVAAVITVGLTITGCTDTQRGRWAALGKPGEVVCYSGGKEIYHGTSTGKIMNAADSDGYEFIELGSGLLIRVTGDCVVKN